MRNFSSVACLPLLIDEDTKAAQSGPWTFYVRLNMITKKANRTNPRITEIVLQ